MNPRHYHSPVTTRAVCPVCKKSVYSRAGIHPQCAMAQAEPRRPKDPTPPTEPAVPDAPAGA